MSAWSVARTQHVPAHSVDVCQSNKLVQPLLQQLVATLALERVRARELEQELALMLALELVLVQATVPQTVELPMAAQQTAVQQLAEEQLAMAVALLPMVAALLRPTTMTMTHRSSKNVSVWSFFRSLKS